MKYYCNYNNEDKNIQQSLSKGTDDVRSNNINVYFNNFINTESITNCIQQLTEAAKNALSLSIDIHIKVPVNLFINSTGGNVVDAFALADFIVNLQKHVVVNTIVQGCAESAATLFSIVGTKRYATKNSYLLIHQVSSSIWGKYDEIKDHTENMQQLVDAIYNHYKKYSKLTDDQLNYIMKRDMLFTVSKCLQYKLIDKII